MLDRLDSALLRLTMRFAHWVDYRWHINHWRIAGWFTVLAAITCMLVPLEYLAAGEYGLAGFLGVANFFCARSYARRLKDLRICSDKWERGCADQIVPYEGIYFLLLPAFIRLGSLFFSIIFIVPLVGLDIVSPYRDSYLLSAIGIFDRLWLLWGDCIALYFAGIPPSRKRRKEKKAIDWAFGLTPAMAGTK